MSGGATANTGSWDVGALGPSCWATEGSCRRPGVPLLLPAQKPRVGGQRVPLRGQELKGTVYQFKRCLSEWRSP